MKKRIAFCSMAAAAVFAACSQKEVPAPEPVLPIPHEKQVEWQKMETYAFIHFGLNTFNDREWGYGDSDPKTFNPTKLDCEQWVRILKQAGMKGVILTAKHHDGFCLWPFEGTEYSVKNSPWRNGKGNLVKELRDACDKYGLKLGLYLSPWDRNYAGYGTPAYIDYYYAQLNDLLTNYGELFEVWFDGANGGDGYYGGAREARKIDRKNYYNYPKIFETVTTKQPKAVIFSDGGPGCRWVGNESGFASATNWSFLHGGGAVYPGYPKYQELQSGHADGDIWVAAECDVSIRPGWFYHPEEDDKVKTPEQLVDLYYRSVGHNGTFLLNFPVDREGLIHPTDSANAIKFREIINQQLKTNLVAGLKPTVSNERGGSYIAEAMTDDDYDTYWATEDGVTTGSIEFALGKPQRMNRMMLQEYIPLGQRVKAFVVEYKDGGNWVPVKLNEETTTIGYKRLLRFETVTTDGIRVRITEARGPLCINNVEVFDAGETSDVFTHKAADIATLPFKVVGVDDKEAEKAFDKQENTTLFATGDKLVLDLGSEQTISSFHYLPDQSEYGKGRIATYELRVGSDANSINQLVKSGEFSNIQNNPIMQSLYFSPVKARYIELKAVRMVKEGETAGAAELRVK